MIVDHPPRADGEPTGCSDVSMSESARLMALEAFQILDTFPEEAYDRIVRRVSQFFAVPICLISFVGRDAQWFKAKIGLDIESAPREASFSQAALEADGVYVVEDAAASARFAGHPAVLGAPGIRFYAGIALDVEFGQKIGILCVADTQPRRFDAAAREALADFGALVVDELHLRLRSRRLEAQLAAQREAKEAELRAQQERAEFLAMVTHEVRTPLNAIAGIAALMCESESSARAGALPGAGAGLHAAPGAAALLESTEHLTRLLNEVLDLARIEATGFTFHAEPFELRRTLRCALDVIRPQTAARGIALVLNVDPETPACIVGDRTRVSQIMLNLLSNAVKFTSRGAITVTAALRRTDDGRAELAVGVADSGVGMDADAAQRLFTSFVQAGPAIQAGYGGTGLGLAICQRLIGGMGGRIAAESAPGVGTLIHFTIPCRVPAAGETPEPGALASRDAAQPLRRDAQRVLVADDDAVSRKVLGALLGRLGYRVDAYASGRAALAALREQQFDVAVVDVHMPDLDGFSLAAELRTQSQFGAPVPVIAVTGRPRAADDLRIDRLFSAYLVKPVNVSALDDAIVAILVRRDGVAAHDTSEPLA